MTDKSREEELRIHALGAAISRREWSEVERAHAAIRDEFHARERAKHPTSPSPPPSAGVDAVAARNAFVEAFAQSLDTDFGFWSSPVAAEVRVKLYSPWAKANAEMVCSPALTPAPTPVGAGGEAVREIIERLEREATEAMALGGSNDYTDTMLWAASELRALSASAQEERSNGCLISPTDLPKQIIENYAAALARKAEFVSANIIPSPLPRLTTHQFKPDRKYPWFCGVCGYGPDEPLQHTQEHRPPPREERSCQTPADGGRDG